MSIERVYNPVILRHGECIALCVELSENALQEGGRVDYILSGFLV